MTPPASIPAQIAQLQAQVEALTARVATCELVIKAIAYPPNVSTCMYCGRDPARPHSAGCAVAIALENYPAA